MALQTSKPSVDCKFSVPKNPGSGFMMGPYSEKLLLDEVNEILYSKSGLMFFDNMGRLPQTPQLRVAMFYFNVASVIFNFKKNMLGWIVYSWLLWFKTENGRYLWRKKNERLLAHLQEYRLADYVYYVVTRILSIICLPYFFLKTRKMKKKWNTLEIYIQLYQPLTKVRQYYFEKN